MECVAQFDQRLLHCFATGCKASARADHHHQERPFDFAWSRMTATERACRRLFGQKKTFAQLAESRRYARQGYLVDFGSLSPWAPLQAAPSVVS